MAVVTYPVRVPMGCGEPIIVPAEDVKEGDFLLGLDYGYVYEDAMPENYYSEERVKISFHTAEGDDAELVAPKDMPVLIGRPL